MATRIVTILLSLAFLLPHLATAVPRNRTGFCAKGIYPLRDYYETQFIDIPVDHFHNESQYAPHSDKTFKNRWWYDDTYYKPGGPVIVENAGEGAGSQSLLTLRIGWLHELAKATNGIAVLLEHRYYGQSVPVYTRTAADFRFLTVQQAMADQAYFAQKVVFPGKERLNLTSPNTPWFAIGCSYPGGLTAFERIQYPDVFWGAISSSGVTVPKVNNWEYFDTVAKYSPPKCASNFGKMINIADNILLGDNATANAQLKTTFGWPANATNEDFAYNFVFGYQLQSVEWLGCEDTFSGSGFCPLLESPTVLFPKSETKFKTAVEDIIANGGWANETQELLPPWLNYLGLAYGYTKDNSSASSTRSLQERSLETSEHSPGPGGGFGYPYTYQQCAQIGGWQTGDSPGPMLPIYSTILTVEKQTEICRSLYNVSGTELSVGGIERYGTYNVSYPRLMLVGGERDPWRQLTPLAELETPTRLSYPSTPDEPWYLIPEGTHCWDYTGIFPYQKTPKTPPEQIVKVHSLEKETFIRWLAEWHAAHPDYNVYA